MNLKAPQDVAHTASLSAGEQMELLRVNMDVQSLFEFTTRLLEEALRLGFAREARSDPRWMLPGRLAAVDARTPPWTRRTWRARACLADATTACAMRCLTATSPAFLCRGSVPLAASIHSVCHRAETPRPRVLAAVVPTPPSPLRGGSCCRSAPGRGSASPRMLCLRLTDHPPGEQLPRRR